MKRQVNSVEKSAASAALPPFPHTSSLCPVARHSSITWAARNSGSLRDASVWVVAIAAFNAASKIAAASVITQSFRGVYGGAQIPIVALQTFDRVFVVAL